MVGNEGDDQSWGSGRGAIAGCHIAGCHCSVVVCYGWGGGWRPTLGEWTWCHCRVPLDVVPLLRAIAGCHCSVLWLGASVTTSGGVDVVPWAPYTAMASRKTALRFLQTLQCSLHWEDKNCFFAIWGLCWYNFAVWSHLTSKVTKPAALGLSLGFSRCFFVWPRWGWERPGFPHWTVPWAPDPMCGKCMVHSKW